MSSLQEYFEDYEDYRDAKELYQNSLKQKVEVMRILYDIEKTIFIYEHFFETGEILDSEDDFPNPDLSPENLLRWDPSDE